MASYSKINSFNALKTLNVGSAQYQIFSLQQAPKLGDIHNSQILKSIIRKFVTL
jgi:aconitate hydratase